MKIYYNLDEVPDSIFEDKKTVFLAGPSSRNPSQTTSYRAEFQACLQAVDSNDTWIVLNPEGPNFDPARSADYALWELSMMERAHVIVISLVMDKSDLIGLTTRVEAGMLFKTRRNLVVFYQKDSFRAKYLLDRAYQAERESRATVVVDSPMSHVVTKTLMRYTSQKNLVQIRGGRFNSLEINPNGCDPVYLLSAIRFALSTHKDGAIYLYLPIDSEFGYTEMLQNLDREMINNGYAYGHINGSASSESSSSGSVSGKSKSERRFKFLMATSKYLIKYCWNNPNLVDKVPDPMTSIAGAFGMIISPDETQILLAQSSKETRGFVGGGVDRNELDLDALRREIFEEIGVPKSVLESQANQDYPLIGGYNQIYARTYGKWNSDDLPLTISDHLSVFRVYLDPTIPLKIQTDELVSADWFLVSDVIHGKVPFIHETNLKIITNYFSPWQQTLTSTQSKVKTVYSC